MRRVSLISALLLAGVALRVWPQGGPPSIPADWKTYSNEKYGFQFKYPPQLEAREDYKLKTQGLFSKKINSALFSVTLLDHEEYAGFSVVVERKDHIFFRSKAFPGFYKYDTDLNAWLGYNPVSTEYGHPGKIYFYLAVPLCAQEETLGPDTLPAYGTTAMVSKSEPHNDIVLSNQDVGFEIPRIESEIAHPSNEALMDTLDRIRDTFQVIAPTKALRADCTDAVLDVANLQVPGVVEPAMGAILDSRKPVHVLLDRKLPPSIGVVFYLLAAETADVDKIVFESPVGDLVSGDKTVLHLQDVPLAPGDAGTTAMSLHVFFYKTANGRKILLGQDFHKLISVVVK